MASRLQAATKQFGVDFLVSEDLYELLNHVNGFAACYEVKGCILTHIPIHPDELNRYRKNIHGHLHSKSIDDSRYVCVSLEHTYMAPIELDILLQ